MEYKRITYEIIDPFPDNLKTNIAFVNIFNYFLYFLVSVFYIIKKYLSAPKKITSFFKKKEVIFSCDIEKDLILLDQKNLFLTSYPDCDKIIKTETEYLSKKKAKSLLKKLKTKNDWLDKHYFSNAFFIKKKIEYINYNSKEKHDKIEEMVFIGIPITAFKTKQILNKFFLKKR